jgi:hypothetical protein
MYEPLGEALGTLVYLAVAGVLTTVGALAELAGIQNLLDGTTLLGAWELAFGAVVLFIGFNVVRDNVLGGGDEAAEA